MYNNNNNNNNGIGCSQSLKIFRASLKACVLYDARAAALPISHLTFQRETNKQYDIVLLLYLFSNIAIRVFLTVNRSAFSAVGVVRIPPISPDPPQTSLGNRGFWVGTRIQ
ncbi:hypothetical protein E2C01_052376 [Portunus trituberculatus]|uniref:Uncharacterized protein n=1 Tax=Portunus trituberculatus TaxID=210409 RepID=A0A5B7GP68_PORTR|nr:hypothetical protein [Portunus trituberculatus]